MKEKQIQDNENFVRAFQAVRGLEVDGWAGPICHAALQEEDSRPTPPISYGPTVTSTGPDFDERSERILQSLQPVAEQAARKWLATVRGQGVLAVLIQGTRTFAEQTAIYNQPFDGKDNDGDGRIDEADEKVSNAKAGSSVHNFGLAWDFVVFPRLDARGGVGEPDWDGPGMVKASEIARVQGLDAGRYWKSFPDNPHIQMPNTVLADLRARFPSGYSRV